PTFSGVYHQFDIWIRDDEHVAVECKFRGKAGIDQVFAFCGKLIDYRKRPQAVFLTTADRVGDEVFCYAIAHRISLISTSLAPVEYMLQQVKQETDMVGRLA